MNNSTPVRSHQRLTVILYSDFNFLALNILENLLAAKCVVNIVTSDTKDWLENTSHITDKSRFFLTKISNYKKISNFSYAIFCGGFIKKQSAHAEFKNFISNRNFGNAKTLAIFPLDTFNFKSQKNIVISPKAGILYVGDLLGARIDLNSNLSLPVMIKEMIEKRRLTLGIGELFYPILVSNASRIITKWLLSFGPYGKESFLVGPQTTSSDFWKANLASFPGLKIIYDTELDTRFVPKGYETKKVNANLQTLLQDTYRWIINIKFKPQKEPEPKAAKITLPAKPVNIPKPKFRLPKKLKIIKPFLLPLFLILFFPVLTALISSGLLYLSYKDFLNDKIQNSQKKALLAKTVFVIGKHESEVLKYTPLVGRFYKETAFISYVGESAADAFAITSPLASTGKDLLNNVLGNGVYDIQKPSQQLKTGLEYLYQQISLVQLVTEENASKNVLSAKQLMNLVDFNTLKNLSQQGVVLANGLPEILGHKENKNYLVLFQNNMELRPTGGFIGSYGIANFGGGRLNGLTVNDIYSADGQLRGHVEPPEPIRKYLNEANWWFRDSNWDPDFPTSAQRAEWFLGKEMGQKVDGVVGIDLNPIKNILKYTGPIFLPDYNLTISSENLYEKTQEEAQANFFPGSRKKATFLTALSRVLINKVSELNSEQRIGILKSIYQGFEERNLQLYVHNPVFQSAVNKLNWDGRLPVYTCGSDCYSDFVGDVEANIGVNKSNYFLSRKLNFSVNIDREKIVRHLDVELNNKANAYLGASGQYQAYIRILIPADAEVVKMELVEAGQSQELSPDITHEEGRREVGAYFEINPGQSKNIKLIWESPIKTEKPLNSYGLYIRKQAGTGSDPVNIKVVTPAAAVFSLPQFSLTKAGASTYNTNLSRDIFARLSWK
jgi:hypothetical protein